LGTSGESSQKRSPDFDASFVAIGESDDAFAADSFEEVLEAGAVTGLDFEQPTDITPQRKQRITNLANKQHRTILSILTFSSRLGRPFRRLNRDSRSFHQVSAPRNPRSHGWANSGTAAPPGQGIIRCRVLISELIRLHSVKRTRLDLGQTLNATRS